MLWNTPCRTTDPPLKSLISLHLGPCSDLSAKGTLSQVHRRICCTTSQVRTGLMIVSLEATVHKSSGFDRPKAGGVLCLSVLCMLCSALFMGLTGTHHAPGRKCHGRSSPLYSSLTLPPLLLTFSCYLKCKQRIDATEVHSPESSAKPGS